MADLHNDRWLDMIERFAARGAEVRVGDLVPGFIRHLLDTVEEQEVTIKALMDKQRSQDARLAALEDKRGDGGTG